MTNEEPQDSDYVVVSLTVVSSKPEHITRASEIFSRTAAGLALDHIDAQLTWGNPKIIDMTEESEDQ